MTQTSSRLLVKSPGKLNLTFDIKGILPDGYHLVDTLMQAVSLEDELVFDIAPAEDFSLTLSAAVADNRQQSELIPLDGKNLISIAAQLFRNELGMLENLKINCTLRKHIPIAGGMGGGSSNAASTLCVLNKHFGNPLSETDIIELGAKIGADVPFFITGGTQLGTNKGEQLSPVRVGAKTWYVIISPLN